MQPDPRPYVAKSWNGRPTFIARQGMDMGNSEIKGFLFEKWIGQKSHKEMDFIELGYSFLKSRSLMSEVMMGRSSYSGPDMFHLVDSNDGKIKMNIWQAVL